MIIRARFRAFLHEAANLIAREVRSVGNARGLPWDGVVLVTTGTDYHDALLAAPIGAAKRWPLVLVGPSVKPSTASTIRALGTRTVYVIGSTRSVTPAAYGQLASIVGTGGMARPAASTSCYVQGTTVANWATSLGLGWNRIALATGQSFPDALAAGPMQGLDGAFIVFTPTTALDAGVASALSEHRGEITEVRFLGRTATAVSGHDGEFEVEIAAAPGAPFPAGPQPVEISTAGVTKASTVHVVPASAPFLVVSDFDDTVAVSQVTSKRKLLKHTFLEDAETQPAVPGMAPLYRCLAASGAPFAFVSGSPIQLAPRIGRFLEVNGYPAPALYLRNLGPKSLSGYKEPVLRTLAARFPQPLVLIGDSGEKDPEIYAALAKELPGRVKRIYVRRAGPKGKASRYEGELLFKDRGVWHGLL